MSVIGIVAEYNPFHTGHLYHIRRSRTLVDEEAAVVCVLSGDFVQRGEAALYAKSIRAEAACRCGADLVVELPLPWSLSSAEGFARGAVSLLAGLGCTHLSFGSESERIEPLLTLAKMLTEQQTTEEIREYLAEHAETSFAAARQAVLARRCGGAAEVLTQPNNILAVEYLKAIRLLNVDLIPVAIPRHGSAHDGRGGQYPSGLELRTALRSGGNIGDSIPAEAAEVFRRADELGRGQTDPQLLEAALLSRLRSLAKADFADVPDASEGLANRLYRAAAEEATLEAVADAVKSKRYALSRIRRMICCAALGVKADSADGVPPYARVLAVSQRGRALLKEVRGSSLPLLTKPAAVHDLGTQAEEVFSLGAAAHDLYALSWPSPEARRGGEDWRTGPLIL